MAIQTLNKILVDGLSKGSTPASESYYYEGATLHPVKSIFEYKNGEKKYKYDNATYRFGYGSGVSDHYTIEADGGDITIAEPTSTKAHGDTGIAENQGWSINTPSGTRVVHFNSTTDTTPHTYNYKFTQSESGLQQSVSITQNGDYITIRVMQILSFAYNNGNDISVNGATQIRPTALYLRLDNVWKSGKTETEYLNLITEQLPSGWSMLFDSDSGMHVDTLTGEYDEVTGTHVESSAQLIDTINVAIADGLGHSCSASYGLYRAANTIQDFTISSTSTSVGNTQTDVRLNAYGTLESTTQGVHDVVNITYRCTWSSNPASGITFNIPYATISENSTSSIRNFEIQAIFGTSKKWLNIEQAAGSGWGNLTISFPFTLTQNDMYMKLLGTGVGYAHGTRISGQNKIVFKGNELARWNEFEGNVNSYGYFLDQSPSSDTGYYNSIGRSHYQDLQAGEPVNLTAKTDVI